MAGEELVFSPEQEAGTKRPRRIKRGNKIKIF